MTKNNINYKELLVKYICHVGASEGIDWICSVDVSPAYMGDLDFSEEEKVVLEDEIFPDAKKRYGE